MKTYPTYASDKTVTIRSEALMMKTQNRIGNLITATIYVYSICIAYNIWGLQ